jgi:hypothetical protein
VVDPNGEKFLREMTLDKGQPNVLMVQVPKKQGGAHIRTAGVTAAVTGTPAVTESNPAGGA